MTKENYAAIFLISWALCLISLFVLIRRKHRLSKIVIQLLGISCLTILCYACTLLYHDYFSIKVAFSCYFASMDWLCYSLFAFAAAFTQHRINRPFHIATLALLGLDSLSMLANIRFNHANTFYSQLLAGKLVLVARPGMLFNLHLALCYFYILLTFILLIRKCILSPRIYRVQYATVLGILVLLVTVNALYLFTDIPIDLSIIGYGAGALLLSYYTEFFLQRNLITKMSHLLLDSLSASILLFDLSGDMIYCNDRVRQWSGKPIQNRAEVLDRLGVVVKDDRTAFETERSFQENGHPKIISIKYSPLLEKSQSKALLGSYLEVTDTTAERLRLNEREYRATHDSLTGLYNRAMFLEQASRLIHEDSGRQYSILLTNIYQFKVYNELFGFEAGNEVLRSVADYFKKSFHGKPDVIYARYDADRFCLCIASEYCTPQVLDACDISTPFLGAKLKLKNYAGVCHVTDPDEPVATLCERAGIALNTIKGSATKTYAYYDQEMRDALLKEQSLVSAFSKALETGEITMYVQPQINQISGALVGGEVLARWIRPDGTFISPGEFVPVLERHGLINTLDRFIWEKAYQLVREMTDHGYPISLSVNLSLHDFYSCDIFNVFTGLCEKYQLGTDSVKLEITESTVMRDLDTHLATIKRLQEKGFILEMDDFGSGYSSLNTLKDIPVDILKMDLRFLAASDQPERSKSIIEVIVLLARTLHLPIIAEGVETTRQAEFLRSVGCSYIQGFLFGKPMPVEQFAALRKTSNYDASLKPVQPE